MATLYPGNWVVFLSLVHILSRHSMTPLSSSTSCFILDELARFLLLSLTVTVVLKVFSPALPLATDETAS